MTDFLSTAKQFFWDVTRTILTPRPADWMARYWQEVDPPALPAQFPDPSQLHDTELFGQLAEYLADDEDAGALLDEAKRRLREMRAIKGASVVVFNDQDATGTPTTYQRHQGQNCYGQTTLYVLEDTGYAVCLTKRAARQLVAMCHEFIK